jgi:hypothetical protein
MVAAIVALSLIGAWRNVYWPQLLGAALAAVVVGPLVLNAQRQTYRRR